MQPDAEGQGAARLGGQLANPGQPLGDLRRGLAPGQVYIRLQGGGSLGRRAGAAEEDLRKRVRGEADARGLDLVVLAEEAERGLPAFRSADPAQHREEFLGALVPLVVAEVVAVPALLRRVAAGDDVEQQPAAGDPLESGGLVGGQGGGDEPGPDGRWCLSPAPAPAAATESTGQTTRQSQINGPHKRASPASSAI